MPAITALGGAAPPVNTRHWWSKRRLAASGAWINMVSTTGAPHSVVTLWRATASNTAAGSIRRRQTWRPATAVTAQVKHQPLQWNMGSVHR